MSKTAIISQPKYLQLKEDLSGQILSGRLKPGSELLSDRKLMVHYSVSHTTVTRALDELRHAGLIERKWGKGTYVLEPRRETTNIAVTFEDMYQATRPFMARIARGMGKEITSASCHIQMFPLHEARIFGGGASSLLMKLLHEGDIHGVIGCDPHPPDDIQQLQRLGIPFVTINHQYPGTNAGSVITDSQSGARDIVRYLVERLGHRKIKLVTGPRQSHSARLIRSSAESREAIITELCDRNVRISADDVAYCNYRWSEVSPVIRKWLESPDRPTAIVLCDDMLAGETARLAGELGLDVPRDLSIIGTGDLVKGSEITTLSLPLEGMGRAAVDMLKNMISGQPVQTRVLPTKLNIRKSTAPAPGFEDYDITYNEDESASLGVHKDTGKTAQPRKNPTC